MCASIVLKGKKEDIFLEKKGLTPQKSNFLVLK